MASRLIPTGANVNMSAGGRFYPSALPIPPARVVPGSYFVPRGARYFGITAEVDMGNLWTLGARWEEALRGALERRLGEACDHIVNKAKSKLVPGHGYDTGLMHDSLHKALVEAVDDWMVAYDLEADPIDVYYWVFVEFGHMTSAGNWWPGYHFLSSSVMESEALIKAKVNAAMADAMGILMAQARLDSALGISAAWR